MSPVAGRRLFVAAVCVALGCSLLAGYRWSARRGARPEPELAVQVTEQLAVTSVIMKARYRGCGHTVSGPHRPVSGRQVSEILNDHPGATLTLLPGGIAEVMIETDGLCPEDAPYRLLTVKDGYVVVYYGRSAHAANLKEVRRDLPVGRLHTGDLRRLERGEVVLGDTAVSRLLEGLLD
ncbi:MAG: hypothetical protein HPY55_13240 [Firmicutes bacterium]|nr:hypothetical protein [Bacillota bacterium]